MSVVLPYLPNRLPNLWLLNQITENFLQLFFTFGIIIWLLHGHITTCTMNMRMHEIHVMFCVVISAKYLKKPPIVNLLLEWGETLSKHVGNLESKLQKRRLTWSLIFDISRKICSFVGDIEYNGLNEILAHCFCQLTNCSY